MKYPCVFWCSYGLASPGMGMFFIKVLNLILARTCSFARPPSGSGCLNSPGEAMLFSLSASGQLMEELKKPTLAHIYTLHKHLHKLYMYHIHIVIINPHLIHITCQTYMHFTHITGIYYTYKPLSTHICAFHTFIGTPKRMKRFIKEACAVRAL